MRYWVGITALDWFQFLRARQPLDEVNFWQPSAGRRPVNLDRGALFLFKLHAAAGGYIVGGGFFIRYTALPARLTGPAAPSRSFSPTTTSTPRRSRSGPARRCASS